jgi:hypothetical protein
MSKTQLLSVTKNLYIARKDTQLFDTKWLLYTVQIQGRVTPKTRNRKSSCSFIFGDTSHISTIQYLKAKIRIHI